MSTVQLLNTFCDVLSIDNFSEQDCITMLKCLDDLYTNDVETLEQNNWTDSVYDTLRSQTQIEYPDNTYFKTIGSDIRTGSSISLPYKMGSLNEIFTQEEIQEWVNTYNLQNELLIITPKFDGNSGEALFSHMFIQSFSRGNGFEGADTTRHMKHILSKYDLNIKQLKKHLQETQDSDIIALRGEVIWKNSEFEKFSHLNYKHPRNAVAGLMNAETTDKTILDSVSFIPFNIDSCSAQLDKLSQLQYIRECGFESFEVFTCLGKDLTTEFLTDTILSLRSKMDYKIDGVVVEVNSAKIRNDIQPININPNPEYAIKFKVDMLPVSAEVEYVEWNISKSGYYKPTIVYKPIDIDGITCTRATGYNARYIHENNIGPGTLIEIIRRGDVVPNCVGVIQSTQAQYPNDIDSLLWTINDKGQKVDLYSPIPTTESNILKLVYCAEKLQIPHLGEGNIRQIHNSIGLTETSELLKIKKETLVNILGANGEKIYNGIMEQLAEVDECVLAAASGVFGRGIGERKFKNILQQTKCRIEDLTVFKLSVVNGVRDKTIEKIIKSIDDYKQWLNNVSGYVNIIPSVTAEKRKFDGIKIVFTGFRDQDLQWYLEKNGATIQSAVSKQTNIVVTPDVNSNSSKLKKCKELVSSGHNIQLLSVEDFKQQYVTKGM